MQLISYVDVHEHFSANGRYFSVKGISSTSTSYAPSRSSLLQVNDALLYHWPWLFPSGGMTCPTQSEQRSPIFKKHISSIFIWPSKSSTLYSNSILSICLLFIKKHTFDHLSIAYLFANYSFSCKTNSSFLLVSLKYIYKNKKIGFYILSTHFLNKNPSYVYCVRLTRTCKSTCMLLLFCWFWLLL